MMSVRSEQVFKVEGEEKRRRGKRQRETGEILPLHLPVWHTNRGANVADVKRVVVALLAGVDIHLVGVFPRLPIARDEMGRRSG